MWNKRLYWLTWDKVLILAMCIMGVVLICVAAWNYYVDWTYQKAEQLIAQEQYVEALEHLNRIRQKDYAKDYKKDYKDTLNLIRLCDSHICYEQGEIEEAYDILGNLNFLKPMRYQTEEQEKAISAYRAELEAAYEPIYKEIEKKRREEYQREQEELLKRIRSDVPYVGMSEKYIDETILGKHAPKVRGNTAMVNGKRYSATIYDFVRKGKVVFSARCIQGKVTEIWDWRDDPSPGYTGSYEFLEEDDPYHASDYRSVERFYEANYDNFFSFEDAESYYRRHKDDR